MQRAAPWWLSRGSIGGDGGPARVEGRGGLRTQEAPLCPLPTYHGPNPTQSHCLIWLGVPKSFLPPWHTAPPSAPEPGNLDNGAHCQPGAELCLRVCLPLWGGV